MLFRHRQETASLNDTQRWEALLRGQVLSVTTQKFYNYINLADQKAQALIILNSILIPVVLGWATKTGEFQISAVISVMTSVLSIMAAIFCIYPKRRHGKKPDGSRNLLHFADIAQMREDEYLQAFNPVFNDLGLLAEATIKDLHDVARRIIRPKFRWLKLSYALFFFGNLMAIAWTFYVMWSMPVIAEGFT